MQNIVFLFTVVLFCFVSPSVEYNGLQELLELIYSEYVCMYMYVYSSFCRRLWSIGGNLWFSSGNDYPWFAYTF